MEPLESRIAFSVVDDATVAAVLISSGVAEAAVNHMDPAGSNTWLTMYASVPTFMLPFNDTLLILPVR